MTEQPVMDQYKDSIQNPTAFYDAEALRIRKTLQPGQEITPEDGDRIGIRHIALVGNSKLKPENFYLRHVDYQSIPPLVYPGKSAILDFLRLSDRGVVDLKERGKITELTFGKNTKTNDAVYIADISEINNAGFEVYYAPLQTNALHVRLVFTPFTGLNYPVLNDLPTIPRYPVEKLANVWRKVRKVNHK